MAQSLFQSLFGVQTVSEIICPAFNKTPVKWVTGAGISVGGAGAAVYRGYSVGKAEDAACYLRFGCLQSKPTSIVDFLFPRAGVKGSRSLIL